MWALQALLRRSAGRAQRSLLCRLSAGAVGRSRMLRIEPLEDRRLLTATPNGAHAPVELLPDATAHRANSLIVQFRDGASSAGSLSAHLATSKVDAPWDLTPGMRTVELDPRADWSAALAAYKSDPNVLLAEPDYHVSLEKLPDDPDFSKLWGLNNTAQNGGTGDADIDAPEAWDVTTGSHNTIVAVIDTGVDYTHPDLAANIWTNPGEIPGNGKDDDGDGYVDDVHGYDFANKDGDPMDDHFHGTHVAGTIGAVGNDGYGISGVNWQVQIMALKFLGADGGGYTSDAIAALNYAVAHGASVVNASWGGGGPSAAFEKALQNAAAKGVIFVAAAGNDGWNNDLDPFYPAGYNVDNVIAVAATDNNDQLAWFSNYGKMSVDLAAPGVDIYSTFPTHLTQAMRDEGFSTDYGTISGTSMATPHVTGVVALVRSLHPDWSYEQVIDQVRSTVDVVDGAAQTITGGRINAAAAVGNAPPDTTGPRVLSTDPSGKVTGTVNHVRLDFNESIDAATISTADVLSLTGPDGAIPVLALVPVAGSKRQFDVTFAPQTTLGSYSLVLGSDIKDLAGNLLDQNRNGTGGEAPDDDVTINFEISSVVGYPSTDVPAPIHNLQTTQSQLTIDQDITISDLNVQLNLTYPYDGDLQIYLTSPSGTVVTLSAFHGDMDPDYTDTVFDDEADGPIGGGFGPYTGTFQPDEPLAAFDGESAKGTWMLSVDAWPFYGFLDGDGFLNSWSLQLEGGGTPPPPPPPPGNRPPVAGDDSLQGVVNTRLNIDPAQLLANDTDPDGDKLSIGFVGNPTGGSVSLGADQFIAFTPDRDFTGAATFQYIVSDGHATAIGNVSVNVQPQFQWNNSANALDVDNDGVVAPGDALIIINEINLHGPSSLEGLLEGSKPQWFVDVSADNSVAPNDALIVINYINAHPAAAGSSLAAGEGESAAANHDAALISLLEPLPAGSSGQRL